MPALRRPTTRQTTLSESLTRTARPTRKSKASTTKPSTTESATATPTTTATTATNMSASSRRYYLIIASRDHLRQAQTSSIIQANYGHKAPMLRTRPGDGIAFYSPRMLLDKTSAPCRRFTGIGTVDAGDAYQEVVTPTFHPWRRKATFVEDARMREVPIATVLDQLEVLGFGKGNYGMVLRRGFVEMTAKDWQVLWNAMVKEE